MTERTLPPVAPRRRGAVLADGDLTAARERLEGPAKRAIETGRNRLILAGAMFALGFAAIGLRLADLGLLGRDAGAPVSLAAVAEARDSGRADIVDRNGVLLATSLATASLYADPRQVFDPVEAADRLLSVLADLDRDDVVARLSSSRHFTPLSRDLTPRQQAAVNDLAIPGLHFQRGERRIWPHGRLASHVIGLVGVDGGLGGIERQFDRELLSGEGPLALSLDLRVQHVLTRELAAVVDEQQAAGASGLVLDVNTGEILGMASLPDFDLNRPGSNGAAMFNRNTLGVYEMGSTFKIFTTAMALEYGTARPGDVFETTTPLRVASYTINDSHASAQDLSLEEIFIRSSNIGSAQIALEVGGERQREFLGTLGLLDRPRVELPEVGGPLVPDPWRPINTMTIAFGHGIAVSPVQLASAVAAVVNGGFMRPATLLDRGGLPPVGQRVISPETSAIMRILMRRVVQEGTGRRADMPGWEIGGKTGTAEQIRDGRYDPDNMLSSFVGVFPMGAPRYLVLISVDRARGIDGNRRRRSGGWVAAPVVGRVVDRIGPMLGLVPAPVREPVPTETPGVIRVSAGSGIATE